MASIGFNRQIWRTALLVLTISSVIGLLPSLFWRPSSTPGNLILSNAIGFSTWATASVLQLWTKRRIPTPFTVLAAIPIGAALGFALAAVAGAGKTVALILDNPLGEWRLIAVNLLLIGIATTCFLTLYGYERLRADLEAERRRAAEMRQHEVSAKLALLQSQIEPHFLFNTLSNIQSAIGSDPQIAQTMLECLNKYLRTSLSKTRQTVFSLADELELVDATLTVAALRMRERLRYDVEVAGDLKNALVPPLVMQPLVENALRHGIEPAMGGGTVKVSAERVGTQLRLRVVDTGVGLRHATHQGVGLSALRERLAALYGPHARLSISSNQPSGVIAEVLFPLQGV